MRIVIENLFRPFIGKNRSYKAPASRQESAHSPKPVPTNEKEAALVDQNQADLETGPDTDKQTWDNPIEFLMSCISMSVGLGNVWRFPFTAYENGGGAFLIPYLIVLLMIGRPMFLLELAVGQFSSSGCVKMWDLAPAFRGIGYGQVIASFIVCSYYCVLIGISFYFLFSSMQSVLPWTVCHPDLADNSTICLPSGQNRSDLNITNDSIPIISSTEQFFSKGVLKENGDISGGIGSPDPALLGCLVLCWFLIYLTLRKGVSSSGKVAYFTAIFPYLVMFTLLIRGLLLPGAIDGIIFLFTPKWEKLLELKVWYAAVTQSFFSLSIGFGSVITFSSYNKFNHNIYRDATIISFMDTMTSMLAGVITFAILGYLSHELGVEIDQTVKSGGGLAFISYPEVVSKFDFCPQLFAILFFLMLITLGMGSAVGLVNVITTVVQETFPNLSQSFVSGLVCVTGLLAGIAYTTPGGQPLLELIDYYGGSMMVLLMAVTWLLVLICVYGIRKLLSDIKFMMNIKLGNRGRGLFWKLEVSYWTFCWMFFVPCSLSAILIYKLASYEPVKYGKVALPDSAQVFGWALFLFGALNIVGYLIYTYVKTRSWKDMFKPNNNWGPKQSSNRMNWLLLTTDLYNLNEDFESRKSLAHEGVVKELIDISKRTH